MWHVPVGRGPEVRVGRPVPVACVKFLTTSAIPKCARAESLETASRLLIGPIVRAVHLQPWQVLVQPWKLGASLDDREGVEFDANGLGARRSLDAACAAQDARCGGERSKEGLLVLRFDVLDKGCPVDLTKPLAHAARVPDPGLGPAHGLDGGSILNPRQLVCWRCLLMASLMAWHRRFAKSPCSRPHRPRENLN